MKCRKQNLARSNISCRSNSQRRVSNTWKTNILKYHEILKKHFSFCRYRKRSWQVLFQISHGKKTETDAKWQQLIPLNKHDLRIYDEIMTPRSKKKLNLQKILRREIDLYVFNSSVSQLNENTKTTKTSLEHDLMEYHSILASDSLDIRFK